MDDSSNSDVRFKETVRLWRAWKTVHEMVADREYELAEDEVNISLERFQQLYCDPDGTCKYVDTPDPKPLNTSSTNRFR
jgi:DNA-directed RNA polymerase I, II, and III subunit RPABC1